jgi:malate/lactate dehydrogenase
MVKIALIGAAGQIGTPLSLLCKAVCAFRIPRFYASESSLI